MNHLNRLLIRAKTAKYGEGKQIIAFVSYAPEKRKYIADIRLWDGVHGSGSESIISEHDTQEEAEAACAAVKARFPASESVVFIMNDIEEE